MSAVTTLRYLGLSLMAGMGLAACEAKKPPEAVPAQAPSSVPDAKAWLEGLYAHYTDGSKATFSVLGDQAGQYFDPEMLKLMEADKVATPADEVGVLDGDPICDCQDFGSLKADVTVKPTGATTATATVILQETSKDFMEGTPPVAPAPKTLTYELVLIDGQWRIHDIALPEGYSLRGLFLNAAKPAPKG